MERLKISPRPDWPSKLEALGVNYHTHDNGSPYWREDACYRFRKREILALEQATQALQSMCIQAVEHVLAKERFAPFAIPPAMIPLIQESWERDEVSIYGRFDFAYRDSQHPKLLEYNADTPTSLVEASIAQWYWLEECFPGRDQYNSLHERLVAAWERASGYLPLGTVYFLNQDTWEDHQTVAYLRDTADQAGLSTIQMPLEDLGWDDRQGAFIDLDGHSVRAAFKLYPWEFMWKDAYAPMLGRQPRPCTFLEPAWKMLLSNKALLAILWELFPDSPYLLPAYLDGPRDLVSYVRKPILAREGSNIELYTRGSLLNASEFRECYGAEGYVFQEFSELPQFEGFHPVLGSWIVDGEPAGLGIREAPSPITDDCSCFVPHYIED